ncbi:MAG: hypothetical protein R3B07_24890 [Polyangiaceae bacterium]
MQALRFGLISVSVGLIVVACGGSTEDTSSGPVPASELIPQLADAICNIQSCCEAAGYGYDAAACKAIYSAGLKEQFEATPNTTYDAVAAGHCLDAVRLFAASCGAKAEQATDACDGVLQGTLPAGAACEQSAECAKPSGGDAYCDGTCVQLPRGALGDGCDTTCQQHDGGTECWSGGLAGDGPGGTAECYVNDGLSCQDGTCAPARKLGEACDWVDCEIGAHCSDAGVCVANGGEGATCSSSQQCTSGFFCGENSGVCTRTLPRGAACLDYDACGDDGACRDDVCVPWFPTEAACMGGMN